MILIDLNIMMNIQSMIIVLTIKFQTKIKFSLENNELQIVAGVKIVPQNFLLQILSNLLDLVSTLTHILVSTHTYIPTHSYIFNTITCARAHIYTRLHNIHYYQFCIRKYILTFTLEVACAPEIHTQMHTHTHMNMHIRIYV